MTLSEGNVRRLAWIVEKDLSTKRPEKGPKRRGFLSRKPVDSDSGSEDLSNTDSSPKSSTFSDIGSRSPMLQDVEDEEFQFDTKPQGAKNELISSQGYDFTESYDNSSDSALVDDIGREVDSLIRRTEEEDIDEDYDELINLSPLHRRKSIDTVVTTGFFRDSFMQKTAANTSPVARIVNINIHNMNDFFNFCYNNLRFSNLTSWKFWQNVFVGCCNMVRRSNYVSTSQNNKLHLQSFIFGVVSTNITFLIKPLVYHYVNFWFQLICKVLKHIAVWLTVVGVIYAAYKMSLNNANSNVNTAWSSRTVNKKKESLLDKKTIAKSSRNVHYHESPLPRPGMFVAKLKSTPPSPIKPSSHDSTYHEPRMHPEPRLQHKPKHNIINSLSPSELQIMRELAAKRLENRSNGQPNDCSNNNSNNNSNDRSRGLTNDHGSNSPLTDKIHLRHSDSIATNLKTVSPKQQEFAPIDNPYRQHESRSRPNTVVQQDAKHSINFTPRSQHTLISLVRTPSPIRKYLRSKNQEHFDGKDVYENTLSENLSCRIRSERQNNFKQNFNTPVTCRSRSPTRYNTELRPVKSRNDSSIDINSFNADSDSIISKGITSSSNYQSSNRSTDSLFYNNPAPLPNNKGQSSATSMPDNASIATSGSSFSKLSGISKLSTNTDTSCKSNTTAYSVDSRNGAFVGSKDKYNKFMRNVTSSSTATATRPRTIFD